MKAANPGHFQNWTKVPEGARLLWQGVFVSLCAAGCWAEGPGTVWSCPGRAGPQDCWEAGEPQVQPWTASVRQSVLKRTEVCSQRLLTHIFQCFPSPGGLNVLPTLQKTDWGSQDPRDMVARPKISIRNIFNFHIPKLACQHRNHRLPSPSQPWR